MKMNYLRDREYNFRPVKSDWKKPAVLVLAAVFLYLFGSVSFNMVFSFISYPLSRLTGEIRSGLKEGLLSQKKLLEENKNLKLENEQLRVQSARVKELEAENLQLRNFKTEGLGNFVRAKVLVKPNHLPYDELILDVGSQNVNGLRPGILVFGEQNVVLGQIAQVEPRRSKVKLYSSANVSLPVSIGEAGSPGVAQGLGGGNFSLTLPRGLDIAVGDPVRTTIVGDYLLGQVGIVKKDENDPFQKIIFRSPYNVFELEWVLVDLKH